MLVPWVLPQNRPQAVSVLAGLRAKVGKSVRVDYSEGVRMPARVYPSPFAMLDPPRKRAPLADTAEIRRAEVLARDADVAVQVLGEAQERISVAAYRAESRCWGSHRELNEGS